MFQLSIPLAILLLYKDFKGSDFLHSSMELRFPPKLLNFPFCFWSTFTQQISNQLRTTNCSKDTSLRWLFETSKPWTC